MFVVCRIWERSRKGPTGLALVLACTERKEKVHDGAERNINIMCSMKEGNTDHQTGRVKACFYIYL